MNDVYTWRILLVTPDGKSHWITNATNAWGRRGEQYVRDAWDAYGNLPDPYPQSIGKFYLQRLPDSMALDHSPSEWETMEVRE